MKTAVLIHGFHLDSMLTVGGRTYDWRDLAIGHGPRPEGRAAYGVKLAYEERADTVIFSTGASEKDGLKEAEYTYKAVLELCDTLGPNVGEMPEDFLDWLERRAHLDTVSQTTSQELDRNLAWCAEHDHWRVILVTSRFHAPRALANGYDARRRNGFDGKMTILVAAANDPSPAPAIFEPPTRPDRPSLPWNELLAGVFSLAPELQEAAFRKISELLLAER